MLRRKLAGQLQRLGQRLDDHDAPLPGERLEHDVVALERRGLPPQFSLDLFGQILRGREQDRRGHRVVLGLRQHVCGRVGRVRRIVRHQERLGRAR